MKETYVCELTGEAADLSICENCEHRVQKEKDKKR